MARYPSALRIRTGADQRTLVLVGELDVHTAAELQHHLDALGTGRPAAIDLAGVDYIDRVGLDVVVDAHRRHDESGTALELLNPSAAVLALIEQTELTEQLRLT